MFKVDDVVRDITEDGTGTIMVIVEDSDLNTGISQVAHEDGNTEGWDTSDLELVTDTQAVHKSKPMELHRPSMNANDLQVDINKYLTSLVERARSKGYTGCITLEIKCINYSGDESDVECIASTSYDHKVTSGDLTLSLDILLRRFMEDHELEVKAIPHYK
jgi:hypothetical protein